MLGVPGGTEIATSVDRELSEGHARICMSATSGGIMILMSVEDELKSEGSGSRWHPQLMSYSLMLSSTDLSECSVLESNEVMEVLLDLLGMHLVAEAGLEELVFASDVCVLSRTGGMEQLYIWLPARQLLG